MAHRVHPQLMTELGRERAHRGAKQPFLADRKVQALLTSFQCAARRISTDLPRRSFSAILVWAGGTVFWAHPGLETD
jgi:hypothetical protein